MPIEKIRSGINTSPHQDESDELLANIAANPEGERRVLQATRQRVKKKYGVSDEVLDKAYGIESRPDKGK